MLSVNMKEKCLSEDPVDLIAIKSNQFADEEEYLLEVHENGIRIEAFHAKGVFYALQTLRQMICTEEALPCCVIYDKPDFAFRGLSNDITRGRVPTVAGLKKIADFCAFFKINIILLYAEHSFAFRELDGIIPAEECLTAAEVKEFVEYCKQLYIEVIPSVAMFGHLYRLLESDKYKHLCELENYSPSKHYWSERMIHHTLDVSNPQSLELIKSFVDQLTEVFPYRIYSPGTDETFDFCKGKNKGKNMIEQYCAFVDDICAYLKTKGKIAVIDDDVMQKRGYDAQFIHSGCPPSLCGRSGTGSGNPPPGSKTE